MIHVALLEPEIAGNAGNVARSCLAAGASLHLIRPLGFRLNEQAIRRAGMDYWSAADITLHASFIEFRHAFAQAFQEQRVFSFTTKGARRHTEVAYAPGDLLLFGPESRGLPREIREETQQVVIPMQPQARSLNLAVSVGIGLYECWRQLGFQEPVRQNY